MGERVYGPPAFLGMFDLPGDASVVASGSLEGVAPGPAESQVPPPAVESTKVDAAEVP